MDGVGFERKGAEQEVGFMEESVDYFSVDDLLLDFPHPETTDFEFEPEVAVSEECKPCVSVKFTDVSGNGFSPSEISVPADDVAELEWLSHFVEDSFSEYSLAYPAVKLPEKTKHGLVTFTPTLFPTPLTKPRTKRCRSSVERWNLSASDAASSSGSASSSLPNTSLKPSISKRQRRGRLGSGGTQGGRRCSHCGVQRTPQWRAGPNGLKTLCNACGVRFKSGRLCPEYRPACSPTFSSELHSNNHREVVEMRRRKAAGFGSGAL